MAVTKGVKQLVAEANARITTVPVAQAIALLGDPGVQFVDIRDVRELEREGMVPGAFHAPRGMLEFWVDPDSPYFKPVFGEPRRFVLYCQSAWRSALATAALQDMGLENVAHVEGGFNGWKAGGGEVAQRAESNKAKPGTSTEQAAAYGLHPFPPGDVVATNDQVNRLRKELDG